MAERLSEEEKARRIVKASVPREQRAELVRRATSNLRAKASAFDDDGSCPYCGARNDGQVRDE